MMIWTPESSPVIMLAPPMIILTPRNFTRDPGNSTRDHSAPGIWLKPLVFCLFMSALSADDQGSERGLQIIGQCCCSSQSAMPGTGYSNSKGQVALLLSFLHARLTLLYPAIVQKQW